MVTRTVVVGGVVGREVAGVEPELLASSLDETMIWAIPIGRASRAKVATMSLINDLSSRERFAGTSKWYRRARVWHDEPEATLVSDAVSDSSGTR